MIGAYAIYLALEHATQHVRGNVADVLWDAMDDLWAALLPEEKRAINKRCLYVAT